MLDKTKLIDSRVKPIGWGGKTLKEMLQESEHLFAQTGTITVKRICRSGPGSPFFTRKSSRICAAVS